MALKTTLWDASEYLDGPESIAAYLEAVFEDGDPALIAAALGDVDVAALPSSHCSREGLRWSTAAGASLSCASC